MTESTPRRVLIVEDKHDGHYLYYVRLLALEALDRGRRGRARDRSRAARRSRGRVLPARPLERITVVETEDRSPRAVEAMATALGVERTVVPDADLWLSPLARRGGWHAPGRLELLVLRSSTQPRPVPGVQAARTGVKRALMARVAAMPGVRLSVLRSSIWRGRSPLPVTRDPITLATTSGAVAAVASGLGIDAAPHLVRGARQHHRPQEPAHGR